MAYTIDGLVLRMKNSGENDKLISVLTAEQGRISVLVKGGRSLKSVSLSATQLFSYSNFEINDRNGFKWLQRASSIRQFDGLTGSIEKISLASYFASVAEELSGENEPAHDILRLTLNSFHALENDTKSPSQIKACFELQCAAMSGFMPDISGCQLCGCKDKDFLYLDVMNGRLLCPDCMNRASNQAIRDMARSEDIREAVVMLPMTKGVIDAFRHVTSVDSRRMLSFELSKEELYDFARCAETYLLSHLGHGFDTLEFYKIMTKN